MSPLSSHEQNLPTLPQQKQKWPWWLWLLILAPVVLSLVPISSFDVWWHMAYGRSLWEQGIMPTHDLYSWTHKGRQIEHIAWIPGLIFYLSWKMAGPLGLVGLKGLACAFWGWLSFFFLKQKGAKIGSTFFVFILCSLLIFPRFGLLRSYFTFYLLFPLLVLLWHFFKKSSRAIWLIPIVFLFWSNCHASFPIPLLWLGLAIFWPLLWERKEPKKWIFATCLLSACVLATLLTPTGIHTWEAIFRIMLKGGTFENYRATMEMMPPQLSDFLTRSLPALGLIGLAIPALFGLSWRKHGGQFLHWLVMVYFLFQMRRYGGIFAVCSLLYIPYWLTELQKESQENRRSFFGWRAAQVIGICFLILLPLRLGWLTWKSHVQLWPRPFSGTIEKSVYPSVSASYLRTHKPKGHMYNVPSHGSFLIWSAPLTPVSIDGRLNLLYLDSFWRKQVGDFVNRKGDFSKFLKEQKIAIALVPYSHMSRQLSKLVKWSPVAYDNHSILYLRRGFHPHNDRLIQNTEYKWLRFDRLGPLPLMIQRWKRLHQQKPTAFLQLKNELKRAIQAMPKKPKHLQQMLNFLQSF